MTVYDVKIQDAAGNDYVFGDPITIERDVTDLETATTIDKAWLTLKSDAAAADVDAELQLVITGTAGDDGQITDDGASSTEGEVTFTLATATHYADLNADFRYQYDIQVKLSGQTLPTTLERGTIRLAAQITQATS